MFLVELSDKVSIEYSCSQQAFESALRDPELCGFLHLIVVSPVCNSLPVTITIIKQINHNSIKKGNNFKVDTPRAGLVRLSSMSIETSKTSPRTALSTSPQLPYSLRLHNGQFLYKNNTFCLHYVNVMKSFYSIIIIILKDLNDSYRADLTEIM